MIFKANRKKYCNNADGNMAKTKFFISTQLYSQSQRLTEAERTICEELELTLLKFVLSKSLL